MVDADPRVTIYHNPACGTSRNTLAFLHGSGLEPTVIEYLVMPPARDVVTDLAARMGLPLRDILRQRGTPYAELGLADPAVGTDRLLDAIETYPILLNRPIVVGPKGVKLCRPSDVVIDLLPILPNTRILKEDGAPFLKDTVISPSDSGLQKAVSAADLPIDDLCEPDRHFYVYNTLDGERIGYAGFEKHGTEALIRSVVILSNARNSGLGSNVVPLLLLRAFEAGARQAYLLTTSATRFFAKLGFKEMERDKAPAAILATRQARSLCPASTILMTRKLGF